jgi:DNA-binding FadR family transcriptional regulator
MDTRLMLELWTADKISLANRSAVASVISRMGQILNIASDMIGSEAFNSYLRADHNLNFHLEFMKIGNNHKHIELYQSLMNYRYLTMRPAIVNDDMIRVAQSQHEAIVEAMKGGNTSDVKRAVSDHMGDSTSRLLQAVEENGGMI